MDALKTGKFIAEKRKEKGLRQQDLADKLHITDKAVSKWERGLACPDVSLLVPLAEALDVSVMELLKGEKIKDLDVKVADEVVVSTVSEYASIWEIKTKDLTKKHILFLSSIIIIVISVFLVVFSYSQKMDDEFWLKFRCHEMEIYLENTLINEEILFDYTSIKEYNFAVADFYAAQNKVYELKKLLKERSPSYSTDPAYISAQIIYDSCYNIRMHLNNDSFISGQQILLTQEAHQNVLHHYATICTAYAELKLQLKQFF